MTPFMELLVVLSCLIVQAIAVPRRLARQSRPNWPVQTFQSTSFKPPLLQVTQSNATLADGLVVYTPSSSSSSKNGESASAMIMTDSGELVWNSPIGLSTNLVVQTLFDNPVLQYWTGTVDALGHGYGKVLILDNTYTAIYDICPDLNVIGTNGSRPICGIDGHDSVITDQGTIVVTTTNVTTADLTSVGGPTDGWVFDSLFYEIDIKTGAILLEWSALKAGIPINETHEPLSGTGNNQSNAFDWFHMNSLQPYGDKYFLNSRHLSQSYFLDSKGSIEWTIDGYGKTGNFSVPPDALFKWEHHARIQNVTNETAILHYFNNNNAAPIDNGTTPTTGLILQLNFKNHSASVVQKLSVPDDPIFTPAEGSLTLLSNGNRFMGYGTIPIMREYGPQGDLRLQLQYGIVTPTPSAFSYRAFKQVWHATPAANPVCVVKEGTVYMSWNGATDVTEWAVYGGSANETSALRQLGSVARSGFETAFNLTGGVGYVSIAAYNGSEWLRNSTVISVL